MAKSQRRDFEVVASDAIDSAWQRGELTPAQRRRFNRAVLRPTQREQIRAAFVQDLAATAPAELSLADVAGKIDFDAVFDLLSQFFPKVAKLKKFAGLFKLIMGAAS